MNQWLNLFSGTMVKLFQTLNSIYIVDGVSIMHLLIGITIVHIVMDLITYALLDWLQGEREYQGFYQMGTRESESIEDRIAKRKKAQRRTIK